MTLREKTLAITSSSILIVSIIFVVLHLNTLQYEIESNLQEQFKGLEKLIETRITQEKKSIPLITRHAILENPKLINHFLNNDRRRLLEATQPLYQELLRHYNGSLKVMHYYKPGVQSFLRMQKPEKFGDITKDHRPMLAHVDNGHTKEPLSGFEAGRFSLAFRVEVPLYFRGEYIGIMDYGIEAESLNRYLASITPIYSAVVAKQKTIKPIQYHESAKSVNGDILYSYTHPLFLTLDHRPQKGITHIDLNKRHYVLYPIELKGFNAEVVAYLLLAKDVTELREHFFTTLSLWTVAALFLVILNIILFNRSFIPTIQELTKQKNLLSKAQSLAHLGHWEIELPEWNICWSDEMYHITGIPANRTITFDTLQNHTDAKDFYRIESNLKQVVQSGTLSDIKHIFIRPNGEKRVHLSQGELIRDEKGNPKLIIGVTWDITEHEVVLDELKELNNHLQKRVDEEIEKQRKQEHMLIEQSRLASMGELIKSIAHHWRQPITAISAIIQDIEDAYLHNELDETYIKSTVNRSQEILLKMSQTINRFRDFVQQDSEKTEFNLLDAMEETISLQQEALADKKILISLENQLPHKSEATAYGYPSEFRQALSNLIENSRDVLMDTIADTTGKNIALQLTDEGQMIIITIEDNGGGIDETVIDKVFDPYFTTKEMAQSTGMGLYMCKVLIEEHMNGKISVSNGSQGARFKIELPKNQKT